MGSEYALLDFAGALPLSIASLTAVINQNWNYNTIKEAPRSFLNRETVFNKNFQYTILILFSIWKKDELQL